MSSWVLIISKGGVFTTSLGNLSQCSAILTVKSFFLWDFPICQFMFTAFCIVTEHKWEKPDSVVFNSPILYLHTWIRSLRAFSLQAEQPQLYQPLLIWKMFHTINYLFAPFLDCLQNVYVSVVLRSPELDPALQVCLPDPSRWKRSQPLTCWWCFC